MRTIMTAALSATLVAALGGCDTIFGSEEMESYASDLEALNGSGVSASADFRIDGSDLTVTVTGNGLAEGEAHIQHVHASNACPDASMDSDGDGLIELGEGAPAYGPVIVPLDSDLADPANNTFPSGSGISYEQSVDVGTLEETLESEAELALDTRVVVVHGAYVANGQVVSAGTSGAEYRGTLPVACGEIAVTQGGTTDGGLY